MLFFIFVIVLAIGFVTTIKYFDHRVVFDSCLSWISVISMSIGVVGVVASLVVLLGFRVGVDANIAKAEARYEMLVYQYENDVYDNDNDLGKRELIKDIQEWNEDLAYNKVIQDNFWIGIYHPNIYDQFEFIELG